MELTTEEVKAARKLMLNFQASGKSWRKDRWI